MGKEKILLIDDNRPFLNAYQGILQNEGYEVDIAESGEEGLEIMKKHGHQVIITDIRFPINQMDGFKIIEEARRINHDCEVIVITGFSELNLARRAIQLDASDFVPKPCQKKDLLSAIKRASEKSKMRRIVREYTETLKNMVDKREEEISKIEEKLIRTEKLTTMGKMAASIIHELRQPLCGMMGFTYMAAEDLPENTKSREYIKRVEEQIMRMEQIVNNISIFYKKSDEGFLPLSINEVVQSTISLFSHQFKNHGILIIKDFDQHLPPITGNQVQLQQVFVNLLSNARDALDEVHDQRMKKVLIKTLYNAEKQLVEIAISDNGIGMDKDVQEKAFISFFTTKENEYGMGLGLSATKRIVSDHDGEVAMESQKDCGSTFKIRLPVASYGDKQKRTEKIRTEGYNPDGL